MNNNQLEIRNYELGMKHSRLKKTDKERRSPHSLFRLVGKYI
jgi:hypothetical protein